MKIHEMLGERFVDHWELLDVLDTFDADRRDAFDTIDAEEQAFEVALTSYHDWLAGECTSYGCRCGSDGCERGETER